MQRTTYFLFVPIVVLALITSSVHAEIITEFNGLRGDDPPQITDIYTDLAEWLSVVPPVTVIDFTDYPPNTLINDQYSDLGITFEPHNNLSNFILNAESSVDGFELAHNAGRTIMQFDEPLTIFASMFPASQIYGFYLDGDLVGWAAHGCVHVGCFAGFILDTPFDEVHIIGTTFISIDNLYFTFDPIPAPGALALLGIAGIAFRRSRRRH